MDRIRKLDKRANIKQKENKAGDFNSQWIICNNDYLAPFTLHTSAPESGAQAGRAKALSHLCTCSGVSQWGLHSVPTSNPGSSLPFLADPFSLEFGE